MEGAEQKEHDDETVPVRKDPPGGRGEGVSRIFRPKVKLSEETRYEPHRLSQIRDVGVKLYQKIRRSKRSS